MDPEIDKLLDGLTEMLEKGDSSTKQISNIPANDTGIQCPIKGSWQNAGGFAPGSPSPNHPTGHQGLDMTAPSGTSIYPLTAGTVTSTGTSSIGGNTASIQHANGLRSYYAHMASVSVTKGDKVNNDTVIGTVGDTGNAKGTSPHLHLQVWKNNSLQDPANFFTVPQYRNKQKARRKKPLKMQQVQQVPSNDTSPLGIAAFFAEKYGLKSEGSNIGCGNNRLEFSREVNKVCKLASLYLEEVNKKL